MREIQETTVEIDGSGLAFLGVIKDKDIDEDPWIVSLCANGIPTWFKIDTGADVTVVPSSSIKALKTVNMEPPGRRLWSWSNCFTYCWSIHMQTGV